MKTTNRVAVKIDDMQKAIKLYEMAATADGVVSVEQGQWRSPVQSPLGFFGMCAYNKDGVLEIISEDQAFMNKLLQAKDLIA